VSTERRDTRDLATSALIVKCIADFTADAIKARRHDLAEAMANGDRVSVVAPGHPDLNLGKVWRTEPKGTAAVTDALAFTDWMIEHYPDRVIGEYQIVEGHWNEVVAVLLEHAPHLLREHRQVVGWAENEVLRMTEQARQACGPGGECDVPGVAYEPPGAGVVTVTLSEDGPAAIEALWRAGRIDLDGTVRALPGGEPS